ncbi:MAG: GAF domain-containing sensor histidine kinase [Betaproteobacteria bacterium]
MHHPTALLAEITADLSAGSDLPALLKRFLEPVVRLAGARAGAVRVLSEDGRRLELVSEVGLPAQVSGAERAVDRHCGVCGAAADGDGIAWSRNLESCARRSAAAYFGHDCRRVMAVPLQHRARVLGIYNLFFERDEEPAAEVAKVLKSVGELLGLALHDARLERENLRATIAGERQMMAAEVHDSVAQTLAFVKMRMPLLEEAVLDHDDARSMRYIGEVRQALSQAHGSLREIISHFRAPLDPRGLLHALQASAEGFRLRTGVEIRFDNRAGRLSLTAAQEAQVFHIVQEALANTEKHAAARHARLAVEQHDDELEVVVEDDGAGFTACDGAPGHHGMKIMDERARRLGGRLELGEREGGGARVCLRFPLQPAAARP